MASSLRANVLNAKNRLRPQEFHNVLRRVGNAHIASMADAAYASEDMELFDALLPYCKAEFVCQTTIINKNDNRNRYEGVTIERHGFYAKQELRAAVQFENLNALQNTCISGEIFLRDLDYHELRLALQFLRTNARLEQFENIKVIFLSCQINVLNLQSFVTSNVPANMINNIIIREGSTLSTTLDDLITTCRCSSITYTNPDRRLSTKDNADDFLLTDGPVRREYLEFGKIQGPLDLETVAGFIKNNIQPGGRFAALIKDEPEPQEFARRIITGWNLNCSISFQQNGLTREWEWITNN